MLVSSFNLSQSFNYAPYLFCKKTVQLRDQFFLYTDPTCETEVVSSAIHLLQYSSQAY
jgi:hypothetical protein